MMLNRFVLLFFLCSFNCVQAETIKIELNMPFQSVSPGMVCGLNLDITNFGDTNSNARLYIALNVGTDDYWFYPSWVKYPEDVDFATMDIPRDYSNTIEVIPEFPWPEDIGEFEGVTFWAVMDDELGLLSNIDMLGNVREWCWDVYNEHYYEFSPEIDPTGPDEGYGHSIRGGGYDDYSDFVRCGDRINFSEGFVSIRLGFRIARSILDDELEAATYRQESITRTIKKQGKTQPVKR